TGPRSCAPSARASSRPSGNAGPDLELPSMRATLAPLAERGFRLLFLSRTVSFIGNAFATTAIAFGVLDVAGSKAGLGYVLAARAAPQVVFLLVGGVWADRLPRHLVLGGANGGSSARPGG